ALVRRRHLAGDVDRPVAAGVGQDGSDRVRLNRLLDGAVVGQWAGVPDGDPGPLLHGLLHGHVVVDAASEIDHPEDENEQQRKDERELRHRLRTLAAKPVPTRPARWRHLPWTAM